MKELGKDCARRWCIALAEPGSYYCAAHRAWGRVTQALCGDEAPTPDWSVGHLQPVTTRIERERKDLR